MDGVKNTALELDKDTPIDCLSCRYPNSICQAIVINSHKHKTSISFRFFPLHTFLSTNANPPRTHPSLYQITFQNPPEMHTVHSHDLFLDRGANPCIDRTFTLLGFRRRGALSTLRTGEEISGLGRGDQGGTNSEGMEGGIRSRLGIGLY